MMVGKTASAARLMASKSVRLPRVLVDAMGLPVISGPH